ncbi:hinge domain of cleavage stimulation factor subunit 2-domain-containing protein [Xylariomycetidae sp. FL0641]|nr:hinge domain of cleavage stimulation factor subunit 2-domain-containing protein [Xylariomycetidae sp. FL0641]
MSSKPPSRVVFVGNIPYGLSEEQISDIFSTAGKVINFRLVYDRETGRPKGFGFAEYPDADSAASAVRNLNDYEIMGRKLRVDYSTEGRVDGDDNNNTSTSHAQVSNGAPYNTPQAAPAGSLPPLPPGKELPQGVTATDAISRTLNTLPPSQLLDILSQMKALATNQPEQATDLLTQAPQLAYAVFQALLLMGLVSPEAITSVTNPAAAAPATAQPPAGYPPAAVPGYSAPATSTPPVAAPYAPPGVAPQAGYAPTPANAGGAAQDPDSLMQMVMSLPQATIDQLPGPEREQIMALRMSLGMGQAR